MRHLPFLIATLAFAAGCRDFSLPAVSDELPASVSSVEGPSASLGGYWRDRIVVRGANLAADVVVRFDPEGIAGEPVEAGADELVIEVPDLGDPGPRTMRISCGRGDLEAEHAFDFHGSGQPRSGQVVDSTSLAATFVALETPFVPSAYAPTAGTTAYEQTLRDLAEIRDDQFFALSPSDFVVSVGLESNALTVGAEFDRILLSSSTLAFPSLSAATWIPTAMIATVDWDGFLHLRLGYFGRASPDFGWVFVPALPGADDRPLGATSLFQDGFSVNERNLEVVTAFLDPVGESSVAQLAILIRQPGVGPLPGKAKVFLLDLKLQQGSLQVSSKQIDARSAPGLLEAVTLGGRLIVAGIAPQLAARPQMLYAVEADALGRPKLEELVFEGSQSVEEALAYPGTPLQERRLEANSLAATADGSRLAVSFGYDVDGSSLPRLALLAPSAVTPGQWRVERTQSSAAIFHSLVFGRRGGDDVLYALEAISGRLVRISLSALRAEAGFSVGEDSTPIAVGVSRDGDRLLVSTLEKGELLQFDASSETFLMPILRDLHFGSLEAIAPEGGAPLFVAFNASKSTQRNSLPLTADLAVSSGGTLLHLGTEAAPGAVVRAGVAVQRDARSLLMLVSSSHGDQAAVRATRIGFDPGTGLSVVSRRCESDWVIDGFAKFPEQRIVSALVSPAGASSTEKRLLGIDYSAPVLEEESFCAALAGVVDDPAWSDSTLGAQCHGTLAPLPDGRTAIRWAPETFGPMEAAAGCSKLSLVAADGSVVDLPLDAAAPELPWARAPLAADSRPCAPSFKPAVFVAVNGGIAAVPVDRVDDGGACAGPWQPQAGEAQASCRGGTPAGVTLFCSKPGDLVALAASPNGRRLYAVADRFGTRMLLELEVDRDPAGSVRALRLASETLLGEQEFAPTSRVSEPAGLAFTEAGESLHVTPGSSAAVLTYQ